MAPRRHVCGHHGHVLNNLARTPQAETKRGRPIATPGALQAPEATPSGSPAATSLATNGRPPVPGAWLQLARAHLCGTHRPGVERTWRNHCLSRRPPGVCHQAVKAPGATSLQLAGITTSCGRNPRIGRRQTVSVQRHYRRCRRTHRRGTSRNESVPVKPEGATKATAVAAQPTATSGTRQACAGALSQAPVAGSVATAAHQPPAAADTRELLAGAPSAAACSVDWQAVPWKPGGRQPRRESTTATPAEMAHRQACVLSRSRGPKRGSLNRDASGARLQDKTRNSVRRTRKQPRKRAPSMFAKSEARAVQSGRAVWRVTLFSM